MLAFAAEKRKWNPGRCKKSWAGLRGRVSSRFAAWTTIWFWTVQSKSGFAATFWSAFTHMDFRCRRRSIMLKNTNPKWSMTSTCRVCCGTGQLCLTDWKNEGFQWLRVTWSLEEKTRYELNGNKSRARTKSRPNPKRRRTMASTTLRRPACFRKYSWRPLDQSQTSTKWFLESSLKTQNKKSYFKTPSNNPKVAQVFHSRFSLTGQEWQTMCPGS